MLSQFSDGSSNNEGQKYAKRRNKASAKFEAHQHVCGTIPSDGEE